MSAISKLLFFLLFFAVNSRGQSNNPPSSCSSSSCGNIRISFPFRLKTEARSCGFQHSNFELDCLNNQTILSVRSKTYFVQEINYDEYTIRLVDSNINRANLSSCPLYSNNEDDWHYRLSSFLMVSNSLTYLNTPVLFVHCLNPVNSSTYVPAPFCGNRSNNFSNSSEIYSYVVAEERIFVSDLEDSCTVDKVVYAMVQRLSTRDNSSKSSHSKNGVSILTQSPPLQNPPISGADRERQRLSGRAPPYDEVRRHHFPILAVVELAEPPIPGRIHRDAHRRGARRLQFPPLRRRAAAFAKSAALGFLENNVGFLT